MLNARSARSSLCGGLRAGVIVACVIGPNAHVLAPGFVLDTTNGDFGRGCAVGAVRDRVRAMLQAFNHGDGRSFDRNLERRAKVFADRIPVAAPA